MQPETKQCQNCQKDFTIEPEDFSFYEKIKVPPPTWCPECRTIRRLLWRNERNWYHRKCDATGQSILSMYPADSPLKVYDNEYWKSDAWDPLEHGREYDFSKKFFVQFKKLFSDVPHPNLVQKNNVNSKYSNYTVNLKNCYFCAGCVTGEDNAYIFGGLLRIKNCLDLHQSPECEFCYELVDSQKSNHFFFGQSCEACVDSMLMYDCRNCTNCFGCVGLRGKNNCIFNTQYSKEEYAEKIEEYRNGSYSKLLEAKEKFEKLKLKTPRKYAIINKSVNVTGDDIMEAKNCKQCFNLRGNVEDCKYSFRVHDNSKDGQDAFIAWDKAEVFYEAVSISGQRIFFSAFIWGGFDVLYSYNCYDCNNIFGCIGLRNKSYCILNRQYTKEEYAKLTEKIIESMKKVGEYGEFFPTSDYPFCYNETLAQDYFPKSKEEILEKGYEWRESEEKKYEISIRTEEIPDNISDVPDSFTEEVIECAHRGKCNDQCATAFRLIDSEIKFYKKNKIPLPRLCPLCRHMERIKMKTPLRLWHRSCMCDKGNHGHEGKCSNEFETSYAPESPEIVYCESCYQKEVY